jgi:DNA repair protein RecN (Recombination protein N)
MLERLFIRDFILVDRLELDFASGFGALTGETGAGKSILVDALGAAARWPRRRLGRARRL